MQVVANGIANQAGQITVYQLAQSWHLFPDETISQ
jgi:hypothetical protein